MVPLLHKVDDMETEMEEKFSEILRHATALGLTADHLVCLESIRNLRSNDEGSGALKKTRVLIRKWLMRGLYLTLAIKAFCVFVWLTQWPLNRADLVGYFFGLNPDDLDFQRCLIKFDSPLLLDLFRPPVDCSMCHNITTVDRVSQITQDSFERKYAYSGRPVVITDATQNWAALEAFSFDFFRGIYAEDSPVLTMSENNCQFFPYKSRFHNLSEVFHMSENRAKLTVGSEPWYIGWSNCDSSAANVLRSYYTRPYFLPDVAESSKTDWIFMGSPGYGAHMHVDNVMNPSWQAQVTGTKLWTLEPPPECYFECQSQIEVEVRPGELIVLDTNRWYHSTLITGSEMSITIGSEYD